MRIRSVSAISLAVIALALAIPAQANNPLGVNSTGDPFRWTSFPITYTVDGGTLGALSNAEANALTTQAFGTWTSVATAQLSAVQNPVIGLGPDGDVSTLAEFNAVTGTSSCIAVNPVIYDADGTITDALFGASASNSTLGFGGACAVSSSGAILGLQATLNGKFVATAPVPTLTRSLLLGVFIHELGHALGLGHSQVNQNCLETPSTCLSNLPGSDIFGVPTMFPIALAQTEAAGVHYATSLSADDISAISTLYPRPSFATSLGTISGIVFFGDGVNHFQGANVIARRVLMADGVTAGDPRVTAISNVSGMFAQVNHGNASLGRSASSSGSTDLTKRGLYTIPGLPPGIYTVGVDSVEATFTGGSNVGPIGSTRNEIFPLPAPSECFGGPESNSDVPAFCQQLAVAGGNTLTNNNIILNDRLATMDFFDTISRNDTIDTATPLTAGTITASISGINSPDIDVYSITVRAGETFKAETFSRRRTPAGVLDSVLELVDSSGTRLSSCRIGDIVSGFTQPCVVDDFTPLGGTFTLDSKLAYGGPAGTFYLRVSDSLGDFRPDFVYDLTTSWPSAQAQSALSLSTVDFGNVYFGTSGTIVVTLSNVGAATLNIGGSGAISITGANAPDFKVTGGSCTSPISLISGATCTVSIAFTPSVADMRAATIAIVSNAPNSPAAATLSGTGFDYTLQPNTGSESISVPAGQPANFVIGFDPTSASARGPGATTFLISGLPTGAHATFGPASLPAGAGQTNVTLTVTTTSRISNSPYVRNIPSPTSLPFIYLLTSVIGMLAIVAARKTAWPARFGGAVCVFCLLACLSGCGGGGGGATSTVTNPSGTPTGTYPLSVTATNGPFTRTATVTLVIQ